MDNIIIRLPVIGICYKYWLYIVYMHPKKLTEQKKFRSRQRSLIIVLNQGKSEGEAAAKRQAQCPRSAAEATSLSFTPAPAV